MMGISLLLAVHGATGSYATAGLATGCLAVGEAVGGPQFARLVDRFGQRRAVPILAGGHCLALVTLLVAAALGIVAAMCVLAVIAGALLPQPGALSAARWSHIVPDRRDLGAAFSLEAVVNNVAFFSAAPLATLLITVAPWAASASAGTLVLLGSLVLAAQHRTEPPVGRVLDARRPGAGGLWRRPFVRVLGVNLGLGLFFGANPLLVTSFAQQHGFLPVAGFLLALSSAASLVSGVLYGAVGGRWVPSRVQAGATVLVAVAVAVLLAAPHLVGLCLMLALAGAAIAPIITTSSQIIEAEVPAPSLTQGFTWVNTASAAGVACGASVIGAALEAGSFSLAVFALFALVTIMAITALPGIRRRGSRLTRPAGRTDGPPGRP